MHNKIIGSILKICTGFTTTLFGKYLLVFIISLMPILELRGGLIAASLLNIRPLNAFLICLIANILVIPFVLFLMDEIFNLFQKINIFNKLIIKWKEKALKNKDIIEKYGYIGIMLFVAVPLPGSGAWTGCLLAVLLNLDKKKSFISALIGVLIAGLIMMVFSYGLLKGLIN